MFITTRSCFVGWFTFLHSAAASTIILPLTLQKILDDAVSFIVRICRQFLYEKAVTASWIQQAKIKLSYYHPLLALKLVMILSLVCLQVAQYDNPSVNPVDVCKLEPRMNWKFLDDISDLISRKKGELLSLFSVESTIKKNLDQNIHALATTLEDGKSCVGEDTTRVQIALSDMRSLSNLFAELKAVQTVVLESTTTTQVEGTYDKKNQDEETGDTS
ncbi:hypothetical protein Tco_0982390 [Tanacetum coccineum]